MMKNFNDAVYLYLEKGARYSLRLTNHHTLQFIKDDFTLTECLLFDKLVALQLTTNYGKGFMYSKKEFANELRCSKGTILKALSKFEKLGFLHINRSYEMKVHPYSYKVDLALLAENPFLIWDEKKINDSMTKSPSFDAQEFLQWCYQYLKGKSHIRSSPQSNPTDIPVEEIEKLSLTDGEGRFRIPIGDKTEPDDSDEDDSFF